MIIRIASHDRKSNEKYKERNNAYDDTVVHQNNNYSQINTQQQLKK